jgi:hypothetical protein
MFTVLPFPVAAGDYAFVSRRGIHQQVFTPGQLTNWVSVGRAGGSGMDPVLAVLFCTLARLKVAQPELAAQLRLHFVGTNYAPAHRTSKLVEPLAREHGVGDIVEEISERVPYFEALSLYAESDAILLIGSVHSDYTASRLLGCVLSRKPILALFHRRSLVAHMAARFSNVFLAAFDETPAEPAFAEQIARGFKWLRAPNFDPQAIDAEIQPWSAEAQTQRQCVIFDSLIGR